jgi:hypothetical protein
MAVGDTYINAQVLSFAFPLGIFCVALLVGFFVRYRQR